MENTNKLNGGKKRALAIMLAALFAAIILLTATKFSFITVLKGPKNLNRATDFADNQYVSAEVSMDLGPFAEKYKTSDESVTGRYILAGLGDGLVAVLLPERYFESEEVIRGMTADWIDGKSEKLTNFIQVTGTVRSLTEQEKELLDKWTVKKEDWLVSHGIISSAEDYSAEFSGLVICVDDIGGTSAVLVYVLSSIAWVLIAAVLIIAIMWTLGKFDHKAGGEMSGEVDILSEDKAEKAELAEEKSEETEHTEAKSGTQKDEPEPDEETDRAEKADEEEAESEKSELKAEEDNIDNV